MKRNVYNFYILLGVGIGIIVTSIFFILNPHVKYKEYSNEEIMDKATELGMVTIKESLNTVNEKNVKDEKLQEEIKITIKPGQTLTNIANSLFESGIIKDKQEFIQFIKDKKMDKKLLSGKHSLTTNLSYTTIMEILTTKE